MRRCRCAEFRVVLVRCSEFRVVAVRLRGTWSACRLCWCSTSFGIGDTEVGDAETGGVVSPTVSSSGRPSRLLKEGPSGICLGVVASGAAGVGVYLVTWAVDEALSSRQGAAQPTSKGWGIQRRWSLCMTYLESRQDLST